MSDPEERMLRIMEATPEEREAAIARKEGKREARE